MTNTRLQLLSLDSQYTHYTVQHSFPWEYAGRQRNDETSGWTSFVGFNSYSLFSASALQVVQRKVIQPAET